MPPSRWRSPQAFSPVAPIHVAPISAHRLFATRALRVFGSEALWVWGPCAVAATAAWMLRRAVAVARAGARPGGRSPAP